MTIYADKRTVAAAKSNGPAKKKNAAAVMREPRLAFGNLSPHSELMAHTKSAITTLIASMFVIDPAARTILNKSGLNAI